MFTLKVALCEDHPADAALLLRFIKQSGINTSCESFTNAEALLQVFRSGLYDLIFFDIYLGGTSGIQAAQDIRQMDQNVTLAFTTASLDHTLESYRVRAYCYLVKPLQPAEVNETLELALAKRRTRAHIVITTEGGKPMDLPLDSILFCEQQGHVIKIHTSSGIVTTSQSERMDLLESRLPRPPFLRCHRSFMVNLDYVQHVDRELRAFIMKNGGRADIKRGNLSKFEEAFKLRIMERTWRDNP